MARRPTRTHPLRDLRCAIGFSQVQFARLIGVTPSTIRRVEIGQLKISHELAGRIFLATGVILIETNQGTRMMVCGDEPYTKQSFQEWRDELTPTSSVATALAGELSRWVEILLLASARPGVGKSVQVFHSLLQALDRINREFDLQKHIDAHLAECHVTQSQLYRVGDLRRNSLLAQMLNFHDDPTLNDEAQIPLTKPIGWLPNRDLFNLLWDHQDLFQRLFSSAGPDLAPELDDKLRQLEKDLEAVM